MKDQKVFRRYAILGAPFQGIMLVFFLLRVVMVSDFQNLLSLEISTSFCITMIGVSFAGITMRRIYIQARNFKSGKLITTDVFSLTRHPMYHGLFIADLGNFFNSGANLYSPFFWLAWLGFVVPLCIAGWCQEQETLARWGDEAERYYSRTPRFLFEWLWFWRIRPM